MKFAIGDVVRDRSTMTLGTVAGVAAHPSGALVAVQASGGGLRFAEPYDLDVLARHVAPMTRGRRVLGRVALALAAIAACIGCVSAQEVGAGWLLMFSAALGGRTAVMGTYRWALRLIGPRRLRV